MPIAVGFSESSGSLEWIITCYLHLLLLHPHHVLYILPCTSLDDVSYACLISFTVAPAAVELLGRGREGLLEVSEGEEVTLECRVEDAKPVAEVVWFKNDQEIHLGEFEERFSRPDEHLNQWRVLLNVFLFSVERNFLL